MFPAWHVKGENWNMQDLICGIHTIKEDAITATVSPARIEPGSPYMPTLILSCPLDFSCNSNLCLHFQPKTHITRDPLMSILGHNKVSQLTYKRVIFYSNLMKIKLMHSNYVTPTNQNSFEIFERKTKVQT